MKKPLILASQSPRRAALLSQMDFTYTVKSADIDEAILPEELPEKAVARLAEEKALKVLQTLTEVNRDSVILASDTIVVVDNRILGKPIDADDFSLMMKSLSGRTHQVLTAICVMCNERTETQVVSTDVEFVLMQQHDIDWYWQTDEPRDKAGGYGIQGLGGQFIKSVNGSYSSVVGLPMVETKQLLTKFGVSP